MVKVASEKGGKYKAAILIGNLGDPNAIGRRDGFFDVVDKNKDIIDVVARIPTEWNADVAFAGLTNAFQANPDINFLFTSSDFMFPQIVQVMKTRNKFQPIGHKDHVIFGGFDGDAMAYELLKDKYLDADGVQDLFKEAELRSTPSWICRTARRWSGCCWTPASRSIRPTWSRRATACGAIRSISRRTAERRP